MFHESKPLIVSHATVCQIVSSRFFQCGYQVMEANLHFSYKNVLIKLLWSQGQYKEIEQ